MRYFASILALLLAASVGLTVPVTDCSDEPCALVPVYTSAPINAD